MIFGYLFDIFMSLALFVAFLLLLRAPTLNHRFHFAIDTIEEVLGTKLRLPAERPGVACTDAGVGSIVIAVVLGISSSVFQSI